MSTKKYREKNKEKIGIARKKYYLENRERELERGRELNKMRDHKARYKKRKDMEGYKKYHRKAVSRYEKKYPEKKKAQQIAQKEIPIPKNRLCQKCNFALVTQRHHPDYSQPRKVFLVCNKCHKEIHNGK